MADAAGPPPEPTAGEHHHGDAFDLDSLLGFFRALSGEIEKAGLLHRLLEIIASSSGADVGLVILQDRMSSQLRVEARIRSDGHGGELLPSIPLSKYTEVAHSVLDHVTQSRRTFVTDDTRAAVLLQGDSYLDDHRARSVMCVPILYKGRLSGLIYLESIQAEGVFTAKRAKIMEALANQTAVSLENARYVAEIHEKAFLEAQLESARAVQESLLPRLVEIPGVATAVHHSFAERTGGDWYGIRFDQRQQRLYAHIGDVLGHGMPAALVASVVSGAINATLDNLGIMDAARSQGECLELIARTAHKAVLSAGSRSRLTMTMLFTCIDIATGACTLLSAGHQPALWIKGARKSALAAIGTPLGGPGEFCIPTRAITLDHGDMLFLYTDGLLENYGPGGRSLRIRELLELCTPGSGLETVKDAVLARTDELWGDMPAKDDCTFMILERIG